MPSRTVHAPPITVTGESVPEGKVLDFLTGKAVKDTPEEYVRQNVERDLVLRYGYPRENCKPEFRVRVGSSNRRIDVAIFPPDTEHKSENVAVVVECKKPGTDPRNKKEGIEQCQSYMAACVNAQYGVWTNGDDRYIFAKRVKAGKFIFESILELPAFGQSEQDAQKPKRKNLKPATADNLLFAFRRCHNYIAGTDGMHKTEAFWELLKLVFAKVEDERSRSLSFYVTPAEKDSRTAAQSAKARIDKLFTDKVVKKYPTIFPTAESQSIQLKPNTVAFVVGQLQSFSLLRSSVDVKGKAYEEIVGSNLRGDRGEFFTPRNACRMAVEMVNPQPGERLLDPASGTGGFLIIGMNHGLAYIDREEESNWEDPQNPTQFEVRERDDRRLDYFRECVFGIDLNPALVRAAKMNMVMNNDGSGGLFQANTLDSPHTWSQEARAALPLGSVDVIVTNPPFGTKITIDDEEVLRQYDLAAMWDETADGWEMRTDRFASRVLQGSQPPEILFIERCVQFLKDGGRMAMVIPNGILNNPALGYVRHWLLQSTQLLAVVDMARELFQPRNDTQTSLVLVRKLTAEERESAADTQLDYPVFMAVAEKIGHDKRGNTIHRRTPDGDDLVVERTEHVPDPKDDDKLVQTVVKGRLVDDELPEVARAYVQWLGDQT